VSTYEAVPIREKLNDGTYCWAIVKEMPEICYVSHLGRDEMVDDRVHASW
jgi:hypothetical protein